VVFFCENGNILSIRGDGQVKKNKRQGYQYSMALPLLTVFCLVTAAAVYCGYLGTKHMILPFFLDGKEGGITAAMEEEKKDLPQEAVLGEMQGQGSGNKSEEKVQSEKPETAGEKIILYTLKFGTYSTEENGNRAVEELAKKSIFSYPVSEEGEYRIYSLPFWEKEDATTFKNGYLAMGEDCFVVPRSFSLEEGFSPAFMKDYIDVLKEISSGSYTGVQRQQMFLRLLEELKTTYGDHEGVLALVDKTAKEAASISGTDNQMLFVLQKTIIMNMAQALVK